MKRSLKLDWHGKVCPSCFTSESLDVAAKLFVRLTPHGSDADESCDGSHEWDDDSSCRCDNCGFTAPVRCFEQWGEEGDMIELTESEVEGETPCEFEIIVSGMINGTPGDGVVSSNEEGTIHVLASSYNPPRNPEFYDLELRRTRPATGEVVVIHELSDLKEDEAHRYDADFSADYPFAGGEWV